MSSEEKSESKWWETAEEHRFALEVLQLRLRREILLFISRGLKNHSQVEKEFKLSSNLVEYHLHMLEKALVIEQTEGGWRATTTGLLYLKNVETRYYL
jgi:predicted transcriptional regulator